MYNIAVGERTTLSGLYAELRLPARAGVSAFAGRGAAIYRDFREGDVRHSRADVGKAEKLLGYAPTHRFREGLGKAVSSYVPPYNRPQKLRELSKHLSRASIVSTMPVLFIDDSSELE